MILLYHKILLKSICVFFFLEIRYMDSNLYAKPYGFGVEFLCTFRLRQTKTPTTRVLYYQRLRDSNLYAKPCGFGVELLCTFRLRQPKTPTTRVGVLSKIEGFEPLRKALRLWCRVSLYLPAAPNKNTNHKGWCFCLAEAEGFEPPWGCPQTVFKTASL